MTLTALLADLFPPSVAAVVAGPDDANESRLAAEERRHLEPMAPSRRLEFTMGRNAARRALAQLGVPATGIGRREGDRDPVWPEGIVGSISHSHGVVAVACARANEVRSIGLDVERAGPLGDDIVLEICRGDELTLARGLAAPHPSDWPKLFFAMKEAGYKAWFPLTRTPLEFHAMRVTPELPARRFTALVDHAATARLGDAPWVLEGRFGWNDDVVVAGAVLRSAV